MIPSELVTAWLARAEELRPYAAPAAEAFERAAAELRAALHEESLGTVNLEEAAAISGYSADHLGRLVKDGTIPNAGRKNAPRIRRCDVPRKATAGASREPDPSLRARSRSQVAARIRR